MTFDSSRRPSLITAVLIGIGSIIGSGWLFAAYYAAKFAGPISILSWIIGALLALCLALLLAEIVTVHQQRGLFARLLTITHNRDYGFVIAVSNWLGVVIVIPSEAEATVQYISTIVPSLTHYVFLHDQLTIIGIVLVCLLMIIYGLLNFWGIKLLAKANNVITTFKLAIPAITGILIMIVAFRPENFSSYKNTIAPYGYSTAFSAVITCGIFYAFFGFNMITVFAKELKNPQRNIPIALILSISICLIIYLLLQVSFIGAIPKQMITEGWHHLDFTSPLAQLTMLLGLNAWTIVLYVDSALSPSGTAIIYSGSSARIFTGMAKDKQMPKYFDRIHPLYNLSRRSLIFTMLLCFILVIFFKNWQKIMIVVTVFQLISCVAVPLSFSQMRKTQPDEVRLFRMPFGKTLSLLIFILISFLLTQAGLEALLLSLILHIVFFLTYSIIFYRSSFLSVFRAFLSSWSIFVYLGYTTFFGYLAEINLLLQPLILTLFFVLTIIIYFFMLNQKDFQKQIEEN